MRPGRKGFRSTLTSCSPLQQKGSNGAPAIDEAEKRRKREEAAAGIRELRKGITLGPDLTIRDLINQGRRF
jgi:hypothetical protein